MLLHLEREAALVAQAQAEYEYAFATLNSLYRRPVHRMALNITQDPRVAEDVLQVTFLKAFTRLEQFRKESRFSTWLTRTAATEALARLRRRRVQKRVSLDGPIETEGRGSMPREIKGRQDDVDEVCGKFEFRAILSRVIGKLFELTVSIVKNRLMCALYMLREKIGFWFDKRFCSRSKIIWGSASFSILRDQPCPPPRTHLR